jgi:hypothetical protein
VRSDRGRRWRPLTAGSEGAAGRAGAAAVVDGLADRAPPERVHRVRRSSRLPISLPSNARLRPGAGPSGAGRTASAMIRNRRWRRPAAGPDRQPGQAADSPGPADAAGPAGGAPPRTRPAPHHPDRAARGRRALLRSRGITAVIPEPADQAATAAARAPAAAGPSPTTSPTTATATSSNGSQPAEELARLGHPLRPARPDLPRKPHPRRHPRLAPMTTETRPSHHGPTTAAARPGSPSRRCADRLPVRRGHGRWEGRSIRQCVSTRSRRWPLSDRARHVGDARRLATSCRPPRPGRQVQRRQERRRVERPGYEDRKSAFLEELRRLWPPHEAAGSSTAESAGGGNCGINRRCG